MYGDRQHEYRIEREPAGAAARAGEDCGRRETTAYRIDDGDQVHRDAKSQHRGARALRDPERGLGAVIHSVPSTAAFATVRFRPAMAAVGERCFGQRSVQLMCVWQAWQPASPATACSRALLAVSRLSRTRVQARLSAAGPR